MKVSTLRKWSWVHRWSSIVCTIFMLMLCVTGLPLIFHHEIDHLLHVEVEPAKVAAGTPKANLDAVLASGMAQFPGEAAHFFVWDRDDPNTIILSVGKRVSDDPSNNRLARVDAHTGAFLDSPDTKGRFTTIMLSLHTDMFAGLPGKLFLGVMGLLFCVAIISGVVVYAPAMRKLDFGIYRGQRPRVVRWLDVHNLAGVLLVTWTLVVGVTGVINTWADLVIKIWQYGQLAEMTSQYRDRAPPQHRAPLQDAVDVAVRTMPDMTPSFVAFPGTMFSSKSHYAVFMRGKTPVTARLLKPALIDAETGKLTDSRDLPWYVTALLISQPLHFGDYGGMPLKIIWAMLDLITIAVLITGLYLWLRRRKSGQSAERAIAQTSGLDAKALTS